ncbi:hypothetical protein M422DRAFT_248549 [Sphaerobolus stellatus SS14]|nr:hypothetical protein M422DRAFT_248549 [Sphaerobolus stellatus SS14]
MQTHPPDRHKKPSAGSNTDPELPTGGFTNQDGMAAAAAGEVYRDIINEWTKATDLFPFRPYAKHSRGDQWAVSDQGKQWITSGMPSYRNMEPPRGLPIDETTGRVKTHRQWWIDELSDMFKKNWPDFDSKEVLGKEYTAKQKELHENRVVSFIEYALRKQREATSSTQDSSDVLYLLINRIRKPVPYNVWAASEDQVDVNAKNLAQTDKRWDDPDMRLSVLMEKRKLLFSLLPLDQQEYWMKQASEVKTAKLTSEDIIAAIPKVYGMMGDSIRSHMNFHCLVLCGGKSPTGEACEEWRCPIFEDPLGFTSTKNWQTILAAFLHGLSKELGVPTDDIVQLPPWQRPAEFTPKVVERLSDVLNINEDGEIQTSLEAARQATENYLESLWALVPDRNGAPKTTPIPWTEVRRNRDNLAIFVEPARLPSESFIFDRPKDLPKNELWKLIDHIIEGGKGGNGTFEVAAKPRRQTRKSRHNSQKKKQRDTSVSETFDLDAVSGSETDSEGTKVPAIDVPRGRKVQKASKSHMQTKPRSLKSSSRGPKAGDSGGSRSRDKAVTKPAPHQRVQQSQRSTETSDGESDEDIVDELQVLFKGEATQVFAGQEVHWKEDFNARQASVDWEADELTEFGATTMESARFIEGGERFTDMTFLDLGQPIRTLPDNVYDMVFDTASPLPDPSDITTVEWNPVLEVMCGRIDAVTAVIRRFHRKAGQLEFVRRVAVHHDFVDVRKRILATRHSLNVILAKEAWRRWARASLQLGYPIRLSKKPGDLLALREIWMLTQFSASVDYKKWSELKWRRFLEPDSILSKMLTETCLTVRPPDEKFTIISLIEKDWQKPAALAAVKEWALEMDDSTFRRGCVIEKFQYIYAILMVKWWGGKKDVMAIKKAVRNCEDWMATFIQTIDPTTLVTCNSERFQSSPTENPIPEPGSKQAPYSKFSSPPSASSLLRRFQSASQRTLASSFSNARSSRRAASPSRFQGAVKDNSEEVSEDPPIMAYSESLNLLHDTEYMRLNKEDIRQSTVDIHKATVDIRKAPWISTRHSGYLQRPCGYLQTTLDIHKAVWMSTTPP